MQDIVGLDALLKSVEQQYVVLRVEQVDDIASLQVGMKDLSEEPALSAASGVMLRNSDPDRAMQIDVLWANHSVAERFYDVHELVFAPGALLSPSGTAHALHTQQPGLVRSWAHWISPGLVKKHHVESSSIPAVTRDALQDCTEPEILDFAPPIEDDVISYSSGSQSAASYDWSDEGEEQGDDKTNDDHSQSSGDDVSVSSGSVSWGDFSAGEWMG